MATTLPAPPERVWPWLAQMGGDRAGFYSWDRLDHHGEPSAGRIVPEWQDLQQGQRLNSEPTGQNWMTVELVEPRRTLVLRSNFELPSGHSFDPQAGPKSRVYLDGIWGFYLQPAPGGQTRLVAHTRGRSRPQPLMPAFSLLVGEPLHFLMQTRQFHGLRARVGAGLYIGDRGPQADRHGCGRGQHEGARRAPIAAAMGRRLRCRPAPR
jgi:proline iminopeptidase